MSEHIAQPTNINFINSSFLIGTPILALTSLVYYSMNYGISWFEPVIFFFFYFASGLSITAGYHRLFSHRTHKGEWPLRLFYALFGAAAFQNSAIKWCSDHRRHHLKTDEDEDPYSVTDGFVWAHIGWVMVDQGDEIVEHVDDLQADKILAWQDRHIFLIGFLVGIVLPGLVGFALLGNIHGLLGGMIYGGFLRVVVVHHATFLINSAAHTWGTQPYSTANTSKDSPLLSFFTFGEGYHNFHHTFQADYRNGHRWYHWDPSKWLIQSASWFGLTKDLHKIPDKSIESRRMKATFERKVEGQYIESDYQEKLSDCVSQLRKGFTDLMERRKEFKQAKKNKKGQSKTSWKSMKEAHRDRIKQCKIKIAEARKEFKALMESLKEKRSNKPVSA
ncbi:fatty acid desaturase [Candidatus Poseidoniales archaeon]|nr:fatty acid desaturase [Candidatus Poseidoniales archaeon]|tara:strand:- start:2498 stop:3667 length:1170 start_codon:yes stop_codon:yes gene_type:complete